MGVSQAQPGNEDTSEAVEFPFEDLFISRTDSRGVIQAGNEVFKRVSGFGWAELIGAPHKLVRHPDMPRGVFQLFWERLRSGQSIGCYVKNRTKNDLHYWVFAYVQPLADGFVSVRQRPSSELFLAAQEIYRKLRAREREENLTPEASRDALLAMLADAGHASYPEFMSRSAALEFSARYEALGRTLPPGIAQASSVATALSPVRGRIDRVEKLFQSIQNVPTNIRILAAQMEQSSGPISVISSNHTALSQELVIRLKEFRRETEVTFDTVSHGLFQACLAEMLAEIVQTFSRETDHPTSLDVAEEMRILASAARVAQSRSSENLTRTAGQSRRFAGVTDEMKRQAAGLDVARVMCKIENARNPDPTGGLREIIDNLENVQSQITLQLNEIAKSSRVITSDAGQAAKRRYG